MFERDSDEQLIRRLRRLAATAGPLAATGDRRRLVMLRGELLNVRAAIAARCETVAAAMRASRVRLGAFAAYSRSAGLARGRSTTPTNGNATGT